MRILVVKLTSMGDVLHLMPALSDLAKNQAELKVDWMVEESFAEIPSWHSSVDKVIPVATRRWRKLKWSTMSEFLKFWRSLRERRYDVVLDAQGLIKSAMFARFAKLTSSGQRIGFSADSIKESFAARFYQTRLSVAQDQHAIERLRKLVGLGFAYQSSTSIDYGLVGLQNVAVQSRQNKSLMFFHGTTWESKHLPETLWHTLISLAHNDGYRVLLAWGSEEEKQRAERLAKGKANVAVLERLSLNELKVQIEQCAGVISVDTGLGHMAAALGTPCVSVYGSTSAELTGAMGNNQTRLQSSYPCSPCFSKRCLKLTEQVLDPPCYSKPEQNGGISAETIWQILFEKIV